jgi:hypothetical protein
MALGGGTWTVQNKILPGSYINFVSSARASTSFADRGVVAIPMELNWGISDKIFSVTNDQFQRDSLKIFGYDYSNAALKNLRDLFKNIRLAYIYRVNGAGVKAQNDFAEAKYSGTRGNDLKIAISTNSTNFTVQTILDSNVIDTQNVGNAGELKANDFVNFIPDATLTPTAGTPLSGGTNSISLDFQSALDKLESYAFNILACVDSNPATKTLFVDYTKRLRDEVGIKFQCVLHQYETSDYEGIISVENNSSPELVYWVAGAEAGCPINESLTNNIYDGEYTIDTNFTQVELENAIQSGKFIFHRVDDTIRVLEDINTFISFTDTKSRDFSNNQVIRVIDQIGNDIANIFGNKYLGLIPNDNAGRVSLWNDIVKHHQDLQRMRAIENFDPESLTVEQGETKKSVVVTDYISPVSSMEILYMSVIVA